MSRAAKWSLTIVILLAVAAAGAALFAHEPAIPTASVDPKQFPEEQVLRGKEVASASMCVVCHTAPGGAVNAGGFHMGTPFGVIVSTNITPDAETGIGGWPFEAFERAMRRGVARDGTHLYPAFPYTSFTKMTDEDMRDLYAYMMSQPPIRNEPQATHLPFPFNQRVLMAGWNLLFLDRDPVARWRRNRRPGIAASTSRSRWATAAPAIRRATRWAPRKAASPTWAAAAPKAGSRRRSTPRPKRPSRGPSRRCSTTCVRATPTSMARRAHP